jgi:hypothetical protein
MGKKIRENSNKIKPVSKTIKMSDFLKKGNNYGKRNKK